MMYSSIFVMLCLVQSAGAMWMQNIPTRTLGGAQLWSDHVVYGEWRIQQNVVTGHFRLLDQKNVRRAWGTYVNCMSRLRELKRSHNLAPLKATAVITIHGLGRTRNAMQGMADYLAEEADWTSINVTYASTRKSVADHALALKNIVDNLDGVSRVHLVGHSLGNIVIRRYLHERTQRRDGPADEPAIGRVVMLAPPNQGSAVARILRNNKLFEWIGGKSGEELGAAWKQLETHLETPQDFGVIAGSTAKAKGMNPLIPGDDDLIVGVEETKLAGAVDFLVVDSIHTTIMDKEEVKSAVLRFLTEGFFVGADQLQPIRTTGVEKE